MASSVAFAATFLCSGSPLGSPIAACRGPVDILSAGMHVALPQVPTWQPYRQRQSWMC
jgi:hypothetical protein